MNHTYSQEFCEPCDSAYRSYACVMSKQLDNSSEQQLHNQNEEGGASDE